MAPDAGLLGERGTAQRQVSVEWLCFIATEIHKSFSPLYRPETPEVFRNAGINHLKKRLALIEGRLARSAYVSGAFPTAADFYLFVRGRWMADMGLRLHDWPQLSDHSNLISAREAVQCALASENLD